jgi:hypothetical protein
VDKLPGGIRVLNDNRDQYVTITGNVYSPQQEIAVGGEFLAWYPVSAMSMPGQATALRVMPLNRLQPDVVINLGSGAVTVGGRKLPVEPLKGENGALFLPLRVVCTSLGYTVEWEKESQTAVLLKDDVFMTATANDNYCGPSLSPVVLEVPPLIRDGVLYAPVEFFTRVLGHTVQVDTIPRVKSRHRCG